MDYSIWITMEIYIKGKSTDSGRYHRPERLLIDSRITGFYEFYDIFIDGITKKQNGFFEIKR